MAWSSFAELITHISGNVGMQKVNYSISLFICPMGNLINLPLSDNQLNLCGSSLMEAVSFNHKHVG